MDGEIAAFIHHARERGMDHSTIRSLLVAHGWKERDIARVLTEHTLDLPVPAPPDTGGAREAFLHLLVFAALYATVVSLVMLLFQLIDHALPDVTVGPFYASPQLSGMRWSVAVLLIAFPCFLWMSRGVKHEMQARPERSWTGVRRWLTYLTLFVAAMGLAGDLIALVYHFLEGELSTRFVLKVLVVLGIAGLVFTYYLLALRVPVDQPRSGRVDRRFALTATVAVVATLVWGLVVTGSPMAERLRRMDDRRIGDLRSIDDEIHLLCLGTSQRRPAVERALVQPLPSSLDDLAAHARYRRPDIRDPRTRQLYGYEVVGESSYRLCAEFDRPRDEDFDAFWNHPAGRHCFEVDLSNDAD